MQRNFRITQGVELTGEFGILDIHNAYELERCEFVPDGQALRMTFGGNEYRLLGRPLRFVLEFKDVTALEVTMLPADNRDLTIERVGFMDAEDRDYDWMLDDVKLRGDEHLVFRAEDGSVVRVLAQSATVTIPAG